MAIVVFIITYVLTSIWLQVRLFLSGLGKKKILTMVDDKKLVDLIREKTGMTLSGIGLIDSDKYFAMMVGGLVNVPVLVLSKRLYQDFDEHELNYVALHEIGHFLFGHSVKEVLVDIALLVIGSMTTVILKTPWFAALGMGSIFGVFAIQLFRGFEYQADEFALTATGNPAGMVSATNKFFKGNAAGHESRGIRKFFGAMFIRSVPYWERVKIAEEFIFKS